MTRNSYQPSHREACLLQRSVQRNHLHRTSAALLITCVLSLCGCSPEVKFTYNAVYALNQERQFGVEFDRPREQEIGNVLTAMFGTPDDPHIPALGGVATDSVLDSTKLSFAAGPVASDELGRSQGLYREHCAHCHGVTGDGAGPTAGFLNPYPRDYRMGAFKFKSTPVGFKPTHDDLKRILVQGIPGTAMPSFLVLPENEIEALVHYVRYLSIRGEFERVLLNYAATELDPEDRLINESGADQAEQAGTIRELAAEVVQKWIVAESMATAVPPPDPNRDRAASIAAGRKLFYDQLTGSCSKCHGDTQLGDGTTNDFDNWTKELQADTDPDGVHEFVALGAFPPRNIKPRNLRLGVYRGGRRPIDLYWRIRNGIEGTPMPAGQKLTDEQIWSLIDYVRHLPFESTSQPSVPERHLQRERL